MTTPKVIPVVYYYQNLLEAIHKYDTTDIGNFDELQRRWKNPKFVDGNFAIISLDQFDIDNSLDKKQNTLSLKDDEKFNLLQKYNIMALPDVLQNFNPPPSPPPFPTAPPLPPPPDEYTSFPSSSSPLLNKIVSSEQPNTSGEISNNNNNMKRKRRRSSSSSSSNGKSIGKRRHVIITNNNNNMKRKRRRSSSSSSSSISNKRKRTTKAANKILIKYKKRRRSSSSSSSGGGNNKRQRRMSSSNSGSGKGRRRRSPGRPKGRVNNIKMHDVRLRNPQTNDMMATMECRIVPENKDQKDDIQKMRRNLKMTIPVKNTELSGECSKSHIQTIYP